MDCDSSDRAALLKIKEQLGNPPELSSWLPATNCCSWDSGIICSETGRVYLVALFSLNVSVPIPSALGDLPLLQTIQLDNMPTMYGPIPSSFAKLSHLELLDITETSISGPIPDFLVKTNLSALSITNSKLTGPIPQSLSRLPNLRVIDLSSNMLTGSIPPGLLHGSSRFLMLSNNQFTGEIPEDYGNGDIDTIDLSHNQLTGNPSFLFDIAKPTAKIDLSWNRLEFDMTKVRFPHHLNYLDLSHNNIKGRVAKSLKDINLRFFNVSYNALCGEIPTGRYMVYHGADCYTHNKCLCGSPLPPCKNGQ
uniref:Leucine-rich repeat-containing N-terminal plant-type domain-containing protein n=1 Tax=Leersia perrieri TaxID=77586 RepID=A0A0D9X9M3_9ORYZ